MSIPTTWPRQANAGPAALKSGEAYSAEFRLRRADGVYRWHMHGGVDFDEDGKIEHWVGSNTDIDDQKEAEAALRESDLRVRAGCWGRRARRVAVLCGRWQVFDLTGDARRWCAGRA